MADVRDEFALCDIQGITLGDVVNDGNCSLSEAVSV